MPSAPLLSVRDLSVRLPSESGFLPVVRGVSFDIAPGEFAAVVGESGCGKSMTAMALSRLPPTDRAEISGSVRLDGRDLLALSPHDLRTVRGRGISYVFQDPSSSLNPVLSIRTQLREALPPGTSRDEADRLLFGLLETVRVPDPARVLRSYPHELSGGLQQRVGVAMAVAASPRLLVADEPTTALDVTTQRSVLELLDRIRRERGIALLLITHNLGLVARHADNVHVMYAGEIVESGPVTDVLGHPAHPYTEGLLGAVPSLDLQSIDDLHGIPGRVPMPSEWGAGCAFAPRCARHIPECDVSQSVCQSVCLSVPSSDGSTDGPTDRRTDRPTDGPTDGPTDRQTDRRFCRCLRAGFSLLEVMAVLLILSILAGFVVGQSKLAKVKGEEARARTDLAHIHAALDRYHDAFGHYPSSADTVRESGRPEGSCIVTNLRAWAEAPSWMSDGVDNADDVYCLRNYFPEATERRGDDDAPFTGLDPWNRPYRYIHDPDVAPDVYRVFSFGPNDPKGEYPDRWIFFDR